MDMKTKLFFSIYPFLILILALNSIQSKDKEFLPACFDAPLWVYSDQKRAYYRQDWCKTSKIPVYWEAIPVFNPVTKNEKFLSFR